MHSFFCTSKKQDDIIFASHIVATIARKTNTRPKLYVHSAPKFDFLYPDVMFSNEFPPELLRASRKPIHQDVIDIGSGLCINVWVRHRRHFFINQASGDYFEAARIIACNCIKFLGLRKKINKKDLFVKSKSKMRSRLMEPYSYSGVFVTFIPQNCFGNDLAAVASASSLLGYYTLEISNPPENVVKIPEPFHLPIAMQKSEIIVAQSQISLIPFHEVIQNKKILLIDDDGSVDIFKSTIAVHNFNDLIKFFKTVVQEKM